METSNVLNNNKLSTKICSSSYEFKSILVFKQVVVVLLAFYQCGGSRIYITYIYVIGPVYVLSDVCVLSCKV